MSNYKVQNRTGGMLSLDLSIDTPKSVLLQKDESCEISQEEYFLPEIQGKIRNQSIFCSLVPEYKKLIRKGGDK